MRTACAFVAICIGFSIAALTPAQDDPLVRGIMSRAWPDTQFTIRYHVVQKNLLSEDMIEKTVSDVLSRSKDDGLDDAGKAKLERETRAPMMYQQRKYDCYFVGDMNGYYFEKTLLSNDGSAPASPSWSAFASFKKGTISIHTRDAYLDTQDSPIIARVGARSPFEGADFAPLFGVQLPGLNPVPDPLVAQLIGAEPDRDGYHKCMAPYPKKSVMGPFDWKEGYMQVADFEGRSVTVKYVTGNYSKPYNMIEFSDYRVANGVPVAGKVVIESSYYDFGLGDITTTPAEEVTLTLDYIRTTPDTTASNLIRGLFTPETYVWGNKVDGTVVGGLYGDQSGLLEELFGSD